MPSKGCFITLEGGEGAGKSTLARGLAAHLSAHGHEVVLTREPGGVPAAEAIRNVLLTPSSDWTWSQLTEALLFNAARHEHLEQLIRPALSTGKTVICDRFADSTRAYQIAGAAGLEQQVADLEQMIVGATKPDITLILDLPVEHGRERMLERGQSPDAFEQRERAFHENVRNAFLTIAGNEPERCIVLDASRPADDVLNQAIAAIDSRVAPE